MTTTGPDATMDLRVGVHEASHAVVAKKLGFKVAEVKTYGWAGHTRVKEDCPADKAMVIAAAGYLGEALWLARNLRISEGKALRQCAREGGEWDLKRLAELSKECGLSREDAEKQATKILRRERSMIERLGKKLAKNGAFNTWWEL